MTRTALRPARSKGVSTIPHWLSVKYLFIFSIWWKSDFHSFWDIRCTTHALEQTLYYFYPRIFFCHFQKSRLQSNKLHHSCYTRWRVLNEWVFYFSFLSNIQTVAVQLLSSTPNTQWYSVNTVLAERRSQKTNGKSLVNTLMIFFIHSFSIWRVRCLVLSNVHVPKSSSSFQPTNSNYCTCINRKGHSGRDQISRMKIDNSKNDI